MTMTEYETTLVLRPDLGGESTEAALDRVRDVIKNKNGKLLGITHWGKKKLAYEIRKQGRGVFVHLHYLGDNRLVAELERILRIMDQTMRFLTIKLDSLVTPDSREEKAYEKPQYDAQDAQADEQDDGPTFGDDGDEPRRFGSRDRHDRNEGRDRQDRDMQQEETDS